MLLIGISSGCSETEKSDTQLYKEMNRECTNPDECSVLHWVQNECQVESCEIIGNVVEIKCKLVFENHDDTSRTISYLRGKFNYWELFGWAKYEKFFEGKIENGDTQVLIPAGEKIEVIYTFITEYNGSGTPKDISIPTQIMFLEK